MTGDKVNKGSVYQEPDGGWRAQISHLGKTYRHRAPSESAARVWLSRKKLQIAAEIADTNKIYEEAQGCVVDFISADLNHGLVQASIYKITKKRKSGSTYQRFCAEVQYLGQKVRRTSPDRSVCENFVKKTTDRINQIIATANGRRDEIRREMASELGKVGAEELSAVLSLFREIKVASTTEAQPTLFGSTYVLFNPYSGFYKIGKTRGPVRRRLAGYCTPEFEIVLVADGDIESEMFEVFKDKRLKGEWFRLDDNDIEQLQKKHGFKKVSVVA